MKSLTKRHGAASAPAHGIDRMVRNVQTGHFERSLSALTAAGALITAAEIFFEHDSASFGNKMMWIPVALGPVGAAAGVAGFCSRRMAEDRAADRLRRDRRERAPGHLPARPGHRPEAGRLGQRAATTWRWGRPAGPAAGHHGRRDGLAGRDPAAGAVSRGPAARPHPGRQDAGGGPERFPGFDVMSQLPHWDAATAAVVESRLGAAARAAVLQPGRGGHRLGAAGPGPRPGRGTAGARDGDDRRPAGRG